MKRLHCGVVLILGLTGCVTVYTDPEHATQEARPDAAPIDGTIVFTTSKQYRGGLLGGVDGADTICANHAAIAGLPGTFKAWISQLDNSAADRLTHSTKPYVLVNGTKVADSWADLLNFDLLHAIDLDEHGANLPQVGDWPDRVWTSSGIDGRSAPWTPGADPTRNPRLDCTLWSALDGGVGLTGAWTATTTSWTATATGLPCTQTARLYCFQQ